MLRQMCAIKASLGCSRLLLASLSQQLPTAPLAKFQTLDRQLDNYVRTRKEIKKRPPTKSVNKILDFTDFSSKFDHTKV